MKILMTMFALLISTNVSSAFAKEGAPGPKVVGVKCGVSTVKDGSKISTAYLNSKIYPNLPVGDLAKVENKLPDGKTFRVFVYGVENLGAHINVQIESDGYFNQAEGVLPDTSFGLSLPFFASFGDLNVDCINM